MRAVLAYAYNPVEGSSVKLNSCFEIVRTRLADGNFRATVVTYTLCTSSEVALRDFLKSPTPPAMQTSKVLRITSHHGRRTLVLRPVHHTLPAQVSTFASQTGRIATVIPTRLLTRLHPLPSPYPFRHCTHTRLFSSSSYLLQIEQPPDPEPPQTSFQDPTRPDLFYHLVFLEPSSQSPSAEPTPVFAVSLLETPPTYAASSTVLGWLPAEAVDGGEGAESAEEGEGGVGLNDFTENREYFGFYV